MPTWSEKLFGLLDDLTHRINSCCGKLDYTPVSGSCGTCRMDGQLRGALLRDIDANKMQRPAGMPRPAPLRVIDPLSHKTEGSGLASLSPEAREDFRKKLQGAVVMAVGGRR